MFDPAFQRMLHGLQYAAGALHAPQPAQPLQPPTVPATMPVRRSITALEALQQAIQCNNPAGNGPEGDQKEIFTDTRTDFKTDIACPPIRAASVATSVSTVVLTPKKEVQDWQQTATVRDDEAPMAVIMPVRTAAAACTMPDQVFRARLPGRRGQQVALDQQAGSSSPPRAQHAVRRGPSPHDPCAAQVDPHEHEVSDSGESIEDIDEGTSEDVLSQTQPPPRTIMVARRHSLRQRSPSAAPANPPEELNSDNEDTESDREASDLVSETGSEQDDISESDPEFAPPTIRRGSKSPSSTTKAKHRGLQTSTTNKTSQKRQLCIKAGCENTRVHDSERCETHLKSRLCNYDGPGGCTQFAQYVGLCARHGGVRKCSAVGCDRGVRRGFVCNYHETAHTTGKRKRKPTTANDDDASTNKIQKLTPQKKTNKTNKTSKTTTTTCTKATGTGASNTVQLMYRGQPKCQFDGPGGCKYKAREGGLCREHGGGRRCEITGCQVIPKGPNKRRCAHHRNIRVWQTRCRSTNCGRVAKQDGLCSAHGTRCGFGGCNKSPTDGDRCSLHGVAQSRRARR